MSNEELCTAIQQGQTERLSELWGQVERFIAQQSRRRAYALHGLGGVTQEDLYQSGFLALIDAVNRFDPNVGMSFVGFLSFALKTAFANASGFHTKRGKLDPLQNATSLDAPISGEGLDDLTLSEVIIDPAAEAAIDDISDSAVFAEALSKLSPDQAEVIKGKYFYGMQLDELGPQAKKLESAAIRVLRHPKNRKVLWPYF